MYLNCHSYYSLRYGTMSEVDLLQLAKEHHITRLALTDINNTSAGLNFVRKAKEFGITPILGIDFRNGVAPCFVGLAENNEGYHELNTFLSAHLHQQKEIPHRAPKFKHAYVIYPFEQVLLHEMTQFSDREFIGVAINDLRKLPFSKLIQYTNKLVVLQPVTFRNKRDYNCHRLLRAIANNTLLSKLPATEEAQEQHQMYALKNVAVAFEAYSFILSNTEKLLQQCSITFDFSEGRIPQNQQHYLASTAEDEALLRQLCTTGIPYRYPTVTPAITARIEKELALIIKMNFVSYFLINWDIVSYARKQNFYYVGRGSGANSIVAYLLRITDVDPMELDLYFERFINVYRVNPPDFDIDFSWRDREAMTSYIFERFPHVTLLGTYVTFQEKGILRELGKVFGLPKEEIDLLCEGKRSGVATDEIAALVFKYATMMQGIPNYLGIHAGGILITQQPITYFSATHLPPKGYPTTHFDMVIAEDVGLYKFDILAQRGLAKIKEAVEIVGYNQPDKYETIDIHDIKAFKNDVNINALIKNAQCMGCFYVESPAMRMLLKKLQVDTYLGLVAASSIIRPGVSKSGMMREYILRHRNPERVAEKAHPVLLNIMPETYGVMVYQEDVIKVAHYFADLDLGEADVLRRGMSGKFRSRAEFEKVKDKFIFNCRKKGYEESVIQEVWHQVASFAGYAFAKGHSASYAVESYQSLFLKTYYPLEYMVAVLNNGGGFYSPEFYLHEARMLGATVYPPCVNNSKGSYCLYGKELYVGLLCIKELEERVVHRILEESAAAGAFLSLNDFIARVPISVEQLSVLIRIEAFRFTNESVPNLLWQAHLKCAKKTVNKAPKLFEPIQQHFELPSLAFGTLESAFSQLELLGFTLNSPFSLLESPPKNIKGVTSFERYLNKYMDIYGYLITVKPTRTKNGTRMYFATLLDQEGLVFDAVLFPPVAKNYKFRGKGVYRLYGKIVSEFGFLSIEVVKMEKQSYVPDTRYSNVG